MSKKILKTSLLFLMLIPLLCQAKTPLWIMKAQNDTTFFIDKNGTGSVIYNISNQSSRAKHLKLYPTTGLSANRDCVLAAKGQTGSSCTVVVTAHGSSMPAGGIHGGPVFCQVGSNGQPNTNQCYQPDANNALNITFKSSSDYSVGGTASGLTGTVLLENNKDVIKQNTDGNFVFPTLLSSGQTYHVRVASNPLNQICAVSNGFGIITDEDINNVSVECGAVTDSYTIGGSISGLNVGARVTLQNNGGDNLTRFVNGAFTFSTPVLKNHVYRVSVLSDPANQVCTVNNGFGIATANVTSVEVKCSNTGYTIGGSISGLKGKIVLENNANDLVYKSGDGSASPIPFTFYRSVANGANYNIKILKQPKGQTCTPQSISGTVNGAPVTVAISCVDITAGLQASTGSLALSISGLKLGGTGPLIPSGKARIITISNVGNTATNPLVVTAPTNTGLGTYSFPAGTSITGDTCSGVSLAAGASCQLTVTPGNTSSTSGLNGVCTGGYSAQPSVITVSATGSNTLEVPVYILGYGCLYQSGYIFSIDDSPASNLSVSGKVIATSSVGVTQRYVWSDPGSIAVAGINENSVAGANSCDGNSDGFCDSTLIANNTSISGSMAQTCLAGNDFIWAKGLTGWYLPAICEWSFDNTSTGTGCGSEAAPLIQNIYSAMVLNGLGGLIPTFIYWASTQYSGMPNTNAWGMDIQAIPQQSVYLKGQQFHVRCVRELSN